MSDLYRPLIPVYYDGELAEPARSLLERHLEVCPACAAELEALRSLSRLLQEAPLALAERPFAAGQRSAAELRLRLPPRPASTGQGRTALPWSAPAALGRRWLLPPLGLIGLWAFVQAALLLTAFLLSGGLPAALTAGLPANLGWPGLPLSLPAFVKAALLPGLPSLPLGWHSFFSSAFPAELPWLGLLKIAVELTFLELALSGLTASLLAAWGLIVLLHERKTQWTTSPS